MHWECPVPTFKKSHFSVDIIFVLISAAREIEIVSKTVSRPDLCTS